MAGLPNSARGNLSVFAWGNEPEFGVPAGALTGIHTRLPLTAGLNRPETASARVTPGGLTERGIPGPVAGPFELNFDATPFEALPWLRHLLRADVTKTTLQAASGPNPGVFRYVLVPNQLSGPDPSFWGLVGMDPVTRHWVYGGKIGQLELTAAATGAVLAKATGAITHGSRLSQPAAEGANTGTYAGPRLRGPLHTYTPGHSLWIRVISLSPLTFKVVYQASAPSAGEWTSAVAQTVYLDPISGSGSWQNCVNQAGADLGIFGDANKDPLEIIWPGLPSAHADADANDTWRVRVPGDWTTPAVTYPDTDGTRMTLAHLQYSYRALGASTWIPSVITTGSVVLANPAAAVPGSGSRYPHDVDRDGILRPAFNYPRRMTDTVFLEFAETHRRFEQRVLFEGAQLGTSNQWRQTIELVMPSAGLVSRTAPLSAAGAVVETLQTVGEANADGDPPLTVTVITNADWTP